MSSKVAAFFVPVVGFVAGAFATAVAHDVPELAAPARLVCIVAVGLSGLVWLWRDAKEHCQAVSWALALGAIIAPVVAVPYHFNQTREPSARVRANALFVLAAVATFGAYWLGCSIA